MQKQYHNADTTNGYNFTFIRDESEVEKAKIIISGLRKQMKETCINGFEEDDDNMKHWKYNNLIMGYIKEMDWLQLKIKEYYERQKSSSTNIVRNDE